MYVRVTPTTPQIEGGSIRIQSYTHSLTADYMGEWADAIPTGLNSSSHYQPDGLVVWPYAGIYLGIGNVFNPFQEAGPQAAIGQVGSRRPLRGVHVEVHYSAHAYFKVLR